MSPLVLTLSVHPSPIDPLALACDGQGRLRGLSFDEARAWLERNMRRAYPSADIRQGETPAAVAANLDAYFAGDRAALDRIAWSLDGASEENGFQAKIWRALTEVPPGRTISYGEMARRVGEPGAAQATGVALNRNPIALVLACHRVVGADGAMTGFGGGLERKTWLLRHEGALLL